MRPTMPWKVYIGCADEDERYRRELDVHIKPLKREGLITVWSHDQMLAGVSTAEQSRHALDDAVVILLLISPSFLGSDDHYSELARAMERHQSRAARLIPVCVRWCDWSKEPFANLQVLPPNANPVSSWQDSDEAWTSVVKGVRASLEEFEPVRGEPFQTTDKSTDSLNVGIHRVTTGEYAITDVRDIEDGCCIVLEGLLGQTLPVFNDGCGNIQIGRLARGPVRWNAGQLTFDGLCTDGACSYRRILTFDVVVTGPDMLTVKGHDVQRDMDWRCTPPPRTSCESRWTMELKKLS